MRQEQAGSDTGAGRALWGWIRGDGVTEGQRERSAGGMYLHAGDRFAIATQCSLNTTRHV